MKKNNKKLILKKIKKLRKEISKHNYKYYVFNNPDITDYQFDLKMRKLLNIEKKYPEFSDFKSPTNKIGIKNKNFSKYITHFNTMYSLDNTYSFKELCDWEQRIKKKIDYDNYICELKYDGVSVSLIYKEGKLLRAVTRGNGYQGDDITLNVKKLIFLPLKLKGNFSKKIIDVRGEIVLPKKKFLNLNKKRILNFKNPYLNPRNTVSGILKLKKIPKYYKFSLKFLIYSILGDNLSSQYDSLQNACFFGFKVSKNIKICKNIEEVFNFIKFWKKKKKKLPYEIDGIVIKVNSYKKQSILGYTSRFPKWAIAYKFSNKNIVTKLLNVKFKIGRIGIVTPIAILKPVFLSGTKIKKASLYNENTIKKLNLNYGDKIIIKKVGGIIPKIIGIYSKKKKSSSIKFIKKCISCNTLLVKNKSFYICPNEENCKDQIIKRMEHFVSRNAMNISSLGKKTIEIFYKKKLIKNVADFYSLKEKNISSLRRIKKKLAKKILKEIEFSKKIPFYRVLYALSIPHVGINISKILVKNFYNIDILMNINYKKISSIKEIGKKIFKNLINFFSKKNNIILIKTLKKKKLNFYSFK